MITTKKIYISLNHNNIRTHDQCQKDMNQILTEISGYIQEPVELIGIHLPDNPIIENSHQEVRNPEIVLLSSNLRLMAYSDYVVFEKDWRNSDICCIEYETARRFGIPMYQQVDDDYQNF